LVAAHDLPLILPSVLRSSSLVAIPVLRPAAAARHSDPMTGAARRQASTAHPRIQGDLASDRDVGGGSFDLVTRMECSFFRPATSCGMGQGRNDDGDLQELNFLTVSSSLHFFRGFIPCVQSALSSPPPYSHGFALFHTYVMIICVGSSC